MSLSTRWLSLVACLISLAIFASRSTRAQDSATSQPSAASGTIAVTVLDSSGQPVTKARVQLYARKKPAAAASGDPPAKNKAIARGSTDEDGKFTFENVADGEYRVAASVRKTGSKGSSTVSVTDDAPNPTVTINLSEGNSDSGGGATTAPSTPPQ
jgi:5-hydroxyisourate hydrolase-like protein (transthyretin family)